MNVSADVFGDTVEILLDFFHILLRVKLTIKRKDMPLRMSRKLMQELSNVFRRPGDEIGDRIEPTEDTETLIVKMEKFITKWENEVSADTLKAFNNLLNLHIKNGCCSNIDPSGGSSINEAVHS